MDQCIICNDSEGSLKTLTAKGLETIWNASLIRGDSLHFNLTANVLGTFRIHDSCRSSYTHKRRLQQLVEVTDSNLDGGVLPTACVQSSSAPVVDMSPVASCTSESVVQATPAAADNVSLLEGEQLFDSERQCLFCGSTTDNNNKKTEIAHLRNKRVIDRVRHFCESSTLSTDTFAKAVKRRLSSVSLDEIRPAYHKKCYSQFERRTRDSSLSLMSVESYTTDKDVLLMSQESRPEQCMGDENSSDVYDDNVFVEQSAEPSVVELSSRLRRNVTISIEHTSPEMSDAETSPCIAHLQQNVCSNCRRIEHDELIINVNTIRGPLINRQYSLMPKNTAGEHKLCENCAMYLTQKLPTSKMWHCAWPSVLAFLLTSDKFKSVRDELWSLMPKNFQYAWDHIYVPVDTEFVCKHSCFEDVTHKRTEFDAYIQSGKISDFMTAMAEYSFPCIKCPAGCFAYVDECTTVAFNDFLAWHFNISVFNGSQTHLKGARKDWPCTSTQLHAFNVCPSVVLDPQYGLCILMCKSHGKRLDKSFVHVPQNPIVHNVGFQCVDSCAAAVLTPNVIRAGRMGKWTNSTHVIKAVGGYGGISSSSLSPIFSVPYSDERLAAVSCLAMRYRSDIYHISRERYIDVFGDDEQFNRMLTLFDTFDNPSPDVIKQVLKGSTFIDVVDCFFVNQRLIARDTQSTDEANPGVCNKTASRSDNGLVVNHSSNAGGSEPFNMKLFVNRDKQPLTGIFLQLILHCPSLYDTLLRACDNATSSRLYDVMQFGKKRAGLMAGRANVKDASRCEEILREEVQRCNINSTNLAKNVAAYLSSFSGEIYSHCHTNTDLSFDIQNPLSAEIIIIYREECRVRRSRRERHAIGLIPEELEDYKLMSALGGKHVTNRVYFRWNDRLAFWYITDDCKKRCVSEVSEAQLHMADWSILLYVKRRAMDFINDTIQRNLGGQKRMWCDTHSQYLIKQSIQCTVQCCVRNCIRSARWSCNGRGSSVCAKAVCFSHGKHFVSHDSKITIVADMDGPILRNKRSTTIMPQMTRDGHPLDSETDDEIDGDTRVLAPVLPDDDNDDNSLPVCHSRQDMIPIFDINRQVAAHFIWNSQYNVMRRTTRHRTTKTAGILQHITSVTNSPCVSLLYPEAQLFPRIFWSETCDTVFGAMPSFMLNSVNARSQLGLASTEEHFFVRIRDGDILTSRENGYWHYMFDVKLNTALNRAPSNLIFRRGLEFLCEGSVGDKFGTLDQESRLPMNEAEATRRVKELASLLKKDKWTYFVTITVNDSETPGVREITKAIIREAAGDMEMQSDLTDSFLPFTLRAWQRFVTFFFQYLIPRNDDIFGKVKSSVIPVMVFKLQL